jgi:hypothetical protein
MLVTGMMRALDINVASPEKPVLFLLTKGNAEEGKYISIKCNTNVNLKA